MDRRFRVGTGKLFPLSPINNNRSQRCCPFAGGEKKKRKNIFYLSRILFLLRRKHVSLVLLLYSIYTRYNNFPPHKPFSISPPTHKSGGPKGAALCTHSAFRYGRRKVVTSTARAPLNRKIRTRGWKRNNARVCTYEIKRGFLHESRISPRLSASSKEI